MNYEVRCECGKVHDVSAADAGSSIRCACGRAVDVPPLHMLRASAGGDAVPTLANVRAALRNGMLPGTRDCSGCGCDTDGHCRVKVVCEHDPNNTKSFFKWLIVLFAVSNMRPLASAGDEEAVIVPLPICAACRPKLRTTSGLRSALRSIPDYAALLDQYPKATFECLP